MRKILFSILSLFISLSGIASDWKSHFSYETPISDVERIGDNLYALSDGYLFSYNVSTSEYSLPLKTWQNSPITKIASDIDNNKLLIVRNNSEIDVYDGNEFVSIPFLRTSNLNLDKTVNDITITDGIAYLSTAFGLLTIDMQKAEVKQLCLFMRPFYSVAKVDGYLYAATSQGAYRIAIEKDYQNFKEWESYPLDEKRESESNTVFDDEDIRKLTAFNGQLYILAPGKGLYYLENNVVKENSALSAPTKLEVKHGKMHVYNTQEVSIYSTTSPEQPIKIEIASLEGVVSDINNDEYWIANSKNIGLSKIKQSASTSILESIRPSGPWSNHPFEMMFTGKELCVVGGGFDKNRFNIPGQLSRLTDSGWYNHSRPIGSLDFVSIGANPANLSNLLIPSWGKGVYEFNDKAYVKVHNQSNSSLLDIFSKSGYVRVNGIKFEGPDKFWVGATMVPKVINVFWKEKNEWKSHAYSHPEIDIPDNDIIKYATVSDLLVDSKNNKWVVSISNPYIFIFNEHGTITDTSDDETRYIPKFYDQDENLLYLSAIKKIKEDKTGNIWLATRRGIFMIKPMNNVFTDKLVLNRLEFAGDGADSSAPYLLRDAYTNNISVDNANRKWVATDENGVYLINSTNTAVLAHFTTENSPLPSNRVLSLAINNEGHVFMGTDKGVVEYSGEFITNSPTDKTGVYVYPNPIAKEFARKLIVKGLKRESFVKIVDIDNNLVASGFATKDGGFEWDGVTPTGEKAQPGSFFLVGVDNSGVEGVLSTLRVIN